jgi:hypothetical protein
LSRLRPPQGDPDVSAALDPGPALSRRTPDLGATSSLGTGATIHEYVTGVVEPSDQVRDPQRLADEVTLPTVHSECAQAMHHVLGLKPFRDDRRSELVGKLDR